jgi:predicted nucleic acid-binding protein
MDFSAGLAIDASVWINLLATEQPWTIVRALGCTCIAPEEVVGEVRRNPVTQQAYSCEHHPLRKQANIEVVRLRGEELDLFLSLVARSSPDALGDGEAAAIAVGRVRRCAVALDDRKARRIARERYPDMSLVMSVEILQHPTVLNRLGAEESAIAFEKALQFGRMHVPKPR